MEASVDTSSDVRIDEISRYSSGFSNNSQRGEKSESFLDLPGVEERASTVMMEESSSHESPCNSEVGNE